MMCVFCRHDETKVIDTRMSDSFVIRRRRECLKCGRRFTTHERVEDSPMKVIKKDGTRVPFNREKLRLGLEKACYKRPISAEQIDEVVRDVETDVNDNNVVKVVAQRRLALVEQHFQLGEIIDFRHVLRFPTRGELAERQATTAKNACQRAASWRLADCRRIILDPTVVRATAYFPPSTGGADASRIGREAIEQHSPCIDGRLWKTRAGGQGSEHGIRISERIGV